MVRLRELAGEEPNEPEKACIFGSGYELGEYLTYWYIMDPII